jgi:hypothetical protein
VVINKEIRREKLGLGGCIISDIRYKKDYALHRFYVV